MKSNDALGIKVYLAAPYTGMENLSFEKTTEKAGELIAQGYIVYSPVTHGHSITENVILPLDHDFWMNQCKPFVTEWADRVMILQLPGVEKSKGVAQEIEWAKEQGIKVQYIKC